MATTAARESIRGFVCPRFPGVELDDDQDIFALGFVNSLFAMELVMFVEREFDVRVPNEELDLANFRTVRAMCDLVGRLAKVSAP
ncbi:acyl carrier protein [Allokutzneria sp. A3M-2-11 16]|uniref:acyl carrier protein n=1 Tax=Allokutzneria sp. A3M-2-11 16 TaxID=2962043 RepID=UPI0020B6E4D4|nr:acyl carrier protein [Allokutzneria sp. A3M-2-11 16]MCP3805308.1 acyl carrier protein [Allokutzneria sp. A3M-2-11 16]